MNQRLSTIELEVAMLRTLNYRQNLIVPNAHWGCDLGYEVDLLALSVSGYASEYELKRTKSDLIRDKLKIHGHVSKDIARLYFVVPKHLQEVALKEIPERAGLYVVERAKSKITFPEYDYYSIEREPRDWDYYKVTKVRECRRNTGARKWSAERRYKLARLGALRIHKLMTKIIELQKR